MARISVLALLCFLAIGCATSSEAVMRTAEMQSPPELASVPVYIVGDRKGVFQGSAIPLGEGELLTARHAVPEDEFMLLCNQLVKFEPTDMPKAGGVANDWAYLYVPGVPASGLRCDFESELKAGTPIYLIGYWSGANGSQDPERAPTIVCAEVLPNNPNWNLSGRVIPVATPHDEVLYGTSGGAAIVLDPETHEPVLVGVYSGRKEWRIFGLVFGSVQMVVRPEKRRVNR